MREIHIDQLVACVEKLCMDANYYLNEDIYRAIEEAGNRESPKSGRWFWPISGKMQILQKRKNGYLPGYRYDSRIPRGWSGCACYRWKP